MNSTHLPHLPQRLLVLSALTVLVLAAGAVAPVESARAAGPATSSTHVQAAQPWSWWSFLASLFGGGSGTTPPATPRPAPPSTTAPAPAPPSTTAPAPAPPATPTAPQGTGLVGWAAQNGGTTGGGNVAATTVTNASAFTQAVSGSNPKVVRVSGQIALNGMVKVGSNTTLVGVGANSGITGGGLTLANAKNVIIRNLTFRNSPDDAINVEKSTNVWIDHNDLAKAYDGLIDIKRGSDFVTVSWNKLHNHDKAMLLGHSDDNGAEDRGRLRVTYHHNWLDGTTQRLPRVRFGNPVHVFNNYYVNVKSYGVASTQGAGVLVERNYFENVRDPYHLGEAASGPGSLVARDNHKVNSGAGQTGGSVAPIPYAYVAEAAQGVKASVMAGAGTGKVG